MSEFSRPLRGYRIAETMHGDTLQIVALRELGDAARWAELANVNNLLPPYLTDDPDQASARVLLTGSVLVVPALTPVSELTEDADPDSLYGLDLLLTDGYLTATDDGDLTTAPGLQTLRQAIVHRVVTERRELMFHPEYGCLVRTLIGAVNGPTASILAAQYVAATLRADPRITEVTRVTAEIIGDTINVVAEVVPVTGRSTKIEISI